jgi:hypothetical protein
MGGNALVEASMPAAEFFEEFDHVYALVVDE